MTRSQAGEPRSILVVSGLLLILTVLVLIAAFLGRTTGEAVILSINDVYRIEGVDEGARGGLARIRALREELERSHPDLLLLHAGDFLFPSLLSDTYDGGQMVAVMNLLDGRPDTFDDRALVTFGNHEFDKDDKEDAAIVADRIGESDFRWLGTDLVFEDGFPTQRLEEEGRLAKTALVNSGGLRVGVFSLTIDSKNPAYVRQFLDGEAIAESRSDQLRKAGADVVVALTHQSVDADRALLQKLGARGPDLIIGGHEHQRHVEEVDGRWIVKADADARTAAVVRVRLAGGEPVTFVGFRFLGPDNPRPDRFVQDEVEGWLVRHDRQVCEKEGKPAGCLSEELATTDVRLVAEEIEIRKYETNLGNWVADQARKALDADVAFLNAGSMRLNQDVPEGPFTERHLRELLPYPNTLVKLEITGELLQRVVNRSIEGWTGEGHFLQVSGFAFRHDPASGTATDLTLLTDEEGDDGTRKIEADTPLTAVTVGFLRDGGDNYKCLDPKVVDELESRESLMEVIRESLEAAGEIAPEVEGRICNSERGDRPCRIPADQSSQALTTASCAEPPPAPAS